jgi:hydroxyacylglutathione hydrolase
VSDLELVAIPNGQFAQNCYLLADRRTGEAVIVDPGEEPEMFLSELESRGWSLGAIWLTHAHVDHIIGVGAIHEATDAPIYLHPMDRAIYDALPQYGAMFGMKLPPAPAPHHELKSGQVLPVGGFEFTVRFTPGHSPGSVSFVGPGMVLSGDALFSGSVGRTDLPGGDSATLLASIHSELLSLPDSTVVHSGHGAETTIGIERMTNPFLTGVYRLA